MNSNYIIRIMMMSALVVVLGCDSKDKMWYEDDAEVEKFSNRVESNLRQNLGPEAAEGFRKGFDSGLRGE